MSGPPLLEVVRRLLERTYRIESGLLDLAPFLIGDMGYRLLYACRPQYRSVADAAAGARTLIRQIGETLHVRVYFPDALIRQLERHPPQQGIGEANVGAFATFVEEIDHLLLVAERVRSDRPVSLFELELHANVSKELVLSRFLAGAAGSLGDAPRHWLRERLFGGDPCQGHEPGVSARYRDAARWALRLLDALPRRRPVERLETLRTFHDAGFARKLELIEHVARATS